MIIYEHAEAVRTVLDAETERAVRVFRRRLEGKYPVIEVILYGSRARGDHKPDSDADLAVILVAEGGGVRDAAAQRSAQPRFCDTIQT
jgi:predicted nucleotidyltransferase